MRRYPTPYKITSSCLDINSQNRHAQGDVFARREGLGSHSQMTQVQSVSGQVDARDCSESHDERSEIPTKLLCRL